MLFYSGECFKHIQAKVHVQAHGHIRTEEVIYLFCWIVYFCISQTVDKLREHLNRHLPRLGKKNIDSMVVNYVAKLVGSVCFCVCVCVCVESFCIAVVL